MKCPDVYVAADLCPCLTLPESFKSTLAAMMDVTLLKDPVFMLISISNFFGMMGLYVPFVYLVDSATLVVRNQSSNTSQLKTGSNNAFII
jgi:predicted MFS family arabinose efflux permease